jgi:LmbE family N-acetylglucosaminyl deacetylase
MPTVLAVMAHPDDIEITCAGTLALLARAGWRVHMATMTAGDMGSSTKSRAVISRIRRREAAAAAAIIGATYSCLEFPDLTIAYNEASKRRVSGLVREARPDLLITHAPVDYMADHEETSRIAREAAFAAPMPNWRATPAVPGRRASVAAAKRPSPRVPVILTADPLDLVDHAGRRVSAGCIVDITSVIAIKERMLASHASQRDWLREQHGEDEYLLWMRRMGRDRARDLDDASVEYAEGFTMHRGHGYPTDDLLTQALGADVVRAVTS